MLKREKKAFISLRKFFPELFFLKKVKLNYFKIFCTFFSLSFSLLANAQISTVTLTPSSLSPWTVPANVTKITVETWGGGGGSGGIGWNSATSGNGGNGGNTTILGMTARGANGSLGTYQGGATSGAAGGVASGGDINTNGSQGGTYIITSVGTSTGGSGGASPNGGATRPGNTVTGNNNYTPGISGNLPGGGAAGGAYSRNQIDNIISIGGGGGGAYSLKTETVSPTQTISYTVGSGGALGIGGSADGGAGANGQILITYSTFSLTATTATSPICSSLATSVTITSNATGLPNGNYSITYTLTGTNAGTYTATNVLVSSNSATFNTIALSGSTTITITNIANASYGYNITANNTASVTVNTSPSVSISGSDQICVNGTTQLSSSMGGNWVSNNTSVASVLSYNGLVTGASAGSTTFTITAYSNGCTATTLPVTVLAIPAAVSVSGGGTFGGSTTITASGGSGGTIYFQGTTSGGTSTDDPSSSKVVTTSGTYYFRSLSSSGCWGPQGSVTVTILPLVSLSINNASISENGGTSTITVTLSQTYSAIVGVNLSITGGTTGGGDYSLNPYYVSIPAGSLTGTATLSATNDSEYETDETVTVSITGTNNGIENGVQEVTITIVDDELPPPSVTLNINNLTILENGGVATITVTLSNTFAATVGVSLDIDAANTTADGGDYSLSPYYVSIPAGNLTGTSTITAVNDANAESAETVTVIITTVNNGTENGNQSVTTTIIDDDSPGITVAPTSGLTTTENGGTVSFSVVLNTQPTADVTITLSSSDLTEGTISNNTLTFTNLNWNTSKSVTVTGVPDGIIDGNVSYSIVTNAATSSDANYNGINPSNVSVTNIDNGVSASFSAVFSGTSTICSGSSSNLVVTITGGGTSPYTVIYTDGTSNFTVYNYTSGTNIPVSPTTNTTYTLFSVTDFNSIASSSNTGTAVVTANPTPSAPSTTGGQICIGSTAILSATGASAGDRYLWYDAASGGNLLKTSIDNTDNTDTTLTLAATTYYWVSILSAAGCESSRTQVTATFPASSPDNQNTAGTNSWIGHVYDGLNFNTYYGYYAEASETFDQQFGIGDNCLTISSSLGDRQIYTDMFSVRLRMDYTSDKGLYVINLGSDDGSRLTIDGTLVYNNWGYHGWTSIPNVLIRLTSNSSLVYEYFENHGGNRITFQSLTLVLSNTLSANTSQSICLGNSGSAISGDEYGTLPTNITLYGTGYQWAYSTSSSGPWNDIVGATSATYTPSTTTAPFNSAGTYYIIRKAILSSTNNVSPNPYVATNESNAATITVNPLPTVTIGDPLTAICQGGTTAALGGSYGGGATGAVWSDGLAGGTFANNNGTTPGTTTYTASSTYSSPVTLTLTSSGGSCGTASDSKQLNVNPNNPVSVTIVAEANPVCAGTFVNFTATPTNGGITPAYKWIKNGFDNNITSNPYNYQPINGDVITCILTSNISCPTDNPATSDPITMTVNAQPSSPALDTRTPDQPSVCDGQNVAATFTAGSGGVGCSDSYRYSTNGGTVWNTYTPGSTISTTGIASVLIQGKRDGCTSDAGCTETVFSTLASWTVNPLPTITLDNTGATTCQESGIPGYLNISSTTNNPNQYSIVFDQAAIDEGFENVTNGDLYVDEIEITVPPNAALGTYYGSLTVSNSSTGCVSSSTQISITVISTGATVSNVTGLSDPSSGFSTDDICPDLNNNGFTNVDFRIDKPASTDSWQFEYSASEGTLISLTGNSETPSELNSSTVDAKDNTQVYMRFQVENDPGTEKTVTLTIISVTDDVTGCQKLYPSNDNNATQIIKEMPVVGPFN